MEEERQNFEGLLEVTLLGATFESLRTDDSHEKKQQNLFVGLIVFSSSLTQLARFTSHIKRRELSSQKIDWNEVFHVNLSCQGPLLLEVEVYEKHKIHKSVLQGKGKIEIKDSGPFNCPLDLQINDKIKGSVQIQVNFSSSTDFIVHNTPNSQSLHSLKTKYDNVKDTVRPKYSVYKYEEVVKHLDTGDIVLFHGIEPHSKLIEVGCLAYWSHACILIRSPSDEIKQIFGVRDYDYIATNSGTTLSDDPSEDIYVFESDYMPIDLREGGGCQLVPLKVWLLDYEAYYSRMHCIIRRLVLPNRTHDHSHDFPQLEEWMKKTAEKQYKTSTLQCVRAVFKMNRTEDLESIFCSELVAATLKHMDLISPLKNCTNITPKDFDKTTYQRKFHVHHWGMSDFELERGASLMEPIRIVYNLAKYTQRVADAASQAPPIPLKIEN